MALLSERTWRYVRGLAAPVLLLGLFVAVLARPLTFWLRGDEEYDRAALQEWIEEARVFRRSLPEMVRDYVRDLDRARAADPGAGPDTDLVLKAKAEEIEEHLKSIGNPPTKMYPGQLPLFPIIYSLEVRFVGKTEADLPAVAASTAGLLGAPSGQGPLTAAAALYPGRAVVTPPVAWDSQLPRHARPFQERTFEIRELEPPHRVRATVHLCYQLHAYNKQQHAEQAARTRLRWVLVLALAGTASAFLWIYLVQHRERDRERQKALARQQIDDAERLLLQEELRRRTAEQRQEETERKLLEQRLATQAAEQQALELKSQLYASIGIMAGSYAHNIKNLLVRPNDLLVRCLEADGLSTNQEQMLQEVRQTLGTVTERLQQILRTVRRDPHRAELTRLDLNALLRDLEQTWKDMAREKWKLDLSVDLAPGPLWIDGDLSHLQQAVENLLFNARDATFEMRNHRRTLARSGEGDGGRHDRRQALIAAAAWRGRVVLRTRQEDGRAVLEVRDNGIGMTEEVRRRCTETHFSTKRDNALYEGHSTGMGLGLSFVTVVLEHHRATLVIDSTPLHGTTFRVSFPDAAP
jgi:signal transduction histidine kinase